MKIKIFPLLFFAIVSFGCTTLPEAESSSEVSYLMNGQLIESYYTKNFLVIEPPQNGLNEIWLNADSEKGSFFFLVVSKSLTGEFTYEDSFLEVNTNRISFHPPNGDPWGYSSNSCTTPTFKVTISEYYPLQQTISGTFEGTVCNDEGKTIEITNGKFEFVKQTYL